MGVYFFGSAVYSLKLAIDRKFWDHQKWIIRHIASGLWVAVQRFLLATVFSAMFPKPVSRHIQRESFGAAATMGIIISIACGEYAIHLLKKEKQNLMTATKKQS
jgi:putative copper export protein